MTVLRIDDGAIIISRHDAGLTLLAIDKLADKVAPRQLHPEFYGLRNQLEAAMMDPASDVDASSNARTQAAQRVSIESVSASVDEHEFTTNDVAELLGCTPANVRDLRTRGKLRGQRRGGRWFYDSRSVIARASQRDR
ncbi:MULTISPECIES: helix-turn-helix domain-containing protein [Nocardiaceae]|uniref:helix-turn-helix domain-containing protein n=1 Tax=Nocardiaceae TaxID=85025 RepID=UPI00055A7BEC|nr:MULTISPECIES: helix-turn-helix domain-containing protein [Rhodococcus]OZF44276.1 DNA-binding protein [Rhodococcus sp. 14-2470-1a]